MQLTAFRALAGLGPAIGGTFFEIDTHANSTSDDPATGTGTGTSTPSDTASGSANNTSGASSRAGGMGSAYELLIATGTAILGAALFVGLL